jgi:hypothetical protein
MCVHQTNSYVVDVRATNHDNVFAADGDITCCTFARLFPLCTRCLIVFVECQRSQAFAKNASDLGHSASSTANGRAKKILYARDNAFSKLEWTFDSALSEKTNVSFESTCIRDESANFVGLVEKRFDAVGQATNDAERIAEHIQAEHEYVNLLEKLIGVMCSCFVDNDIRGECLM